MSPATIMEWPTACRKGLTPECFKKHPKWAKQMFAQRFMRCLLPPWLTRQLYRLYPILLEPPIPPPVPPVPPFPPVPPVPPVPPFPPVPPVPPIPPGPPVPPVPPGPIPPWPIPPHPPWPPPPGPPHPPHPIPPGEVIESRVTAEDDKREGMGSISWAGSHGAASGNMLFGPETETDKAILALVDGIDHYIYRSFFSFDLSAIPAGASIVSCKLKVENFGIETCEACIQKGTQTGDPFGGDYSAFTGNLFAAQAWSSGSIYFTLNTSGLAYIQSVFGSIAKLCMREYDHDYLNIEPGDPEDFHAGLYWSCTASPAFRPKLIVKYVE